MNFIVQERIYIHKHIIIINFQNRTDTMLYNKYPDFQKQLYLD